MTRFLWRRAWHARFALVMLLSACAMPPAQADDDNDGYDIGLWGDLPYSTLQETVGVPNLLADMNAHKLRFSVHAGDLKQGSGSLCDDALYHRIAGFLNSLRSAAMVTPGDNDWTDCDRPANGGFNSRERLDRERQVFFSTAFSLGQKPLRQDVQTEALCLGVIGPVPCVENRRWSVGGVLYVTLNIPGSCNNLCDTAPDAAEFQARDAANIKWLRESFEIAVQQRTAGVMVIAQANPGWDQSDPTRAPLRDPRTLAQTDGAPDGYREFLQAFRDLVVAFRRPVAYVHGDSHYFRIDKPFQDAQGRRLENFTRVETFGNNAQNGNNDVHWIKATVDPKSREVFSYQLMIVPANRVAVPAP